MKFRSNIIYYRLVWHQLENHFHSEDRTMRAHSIIITRISQDPRSQNPRLEENQMYSNFEKKEVQH